MEKSAKIIQYGLGKKTFRFDLGLSFDQGDFERMIGSGSGGNGDGGCGGRLVADTTNK